MTHNENIVTFDDVVKRIELEDVHLEAYKSFEKEYIIEEVSPSNIQPNYQKDKKGKKDVSNFKKKKSFKKGKKVRKKTNLRMINLPTKQWVTS